MSDRFNESMFGQLADDEDDSMGDFMSVLLSSPSPEKRRRQAFENFPAQFTYEGQRYTKIWFLPVDSTCLSIWFLL